MATLEPILRIHFIKGICKPCSPVTPTSLWCLYSVGQVWPCNFPLHQANPMTKHHFFCDVHNGHPYAEPFHLQNVVMIFALESLFRKKQPCLPSEIHLIMCLFTHWPCHKCLKNCLLVTHCQDQLSWWGMKNRCCETSEKINIKQDTETLILIKFGNQWTQGLRDQELSLKKPHCFYWAFYHFVRWGGSCTYRIWFFYYFKSNIASSWLRFHSGL